LGDNFGLFDVHALDGRFERVNLPPLPAGQYWVNAGYKNGELAVAAVPERGAILLGFVGCACLSRLAK
jgi:hypothetical protein